MLHIDISKQLHGADGVMDLKIRCSIKQGEFVAISGQSGSGKTTLLRILAGLEEAEGNISIHNKQWLEGKKALAPQQRKIGFVFQDYALFENMTVEENLLFVKDDRKLAKYLLEVTELSSLKKRLPSTLSGGQKQRVSLCRALMNRPKLLLLDEPLSALDATMRLKLQDEILQLHKEFGTTTIMVSHDASEIYRLASRVLVLEGGKIVKDGSVKELMLKEDNALEGELLALREDNVAMVLVGQQLIEVTFSKEEAQTLQVGDFINLTANKNL